MFWWQLEHLRGGPPVPVLVTVEDLLDARASIPTIRSLLAARGVRAVGFVQPESFDPDRDGEALAGWLADGHSLGWQVDYAGRWSAPLEALVARRARVDPLLADGPRVFRFSGPGEDGPTDEIDQTCEEIIDGGWRELPHTVEIIGYAVAGGPHFLEAYLDTARALVRRAETVSADDAGRSLPQVLSFVASDAAAEIAWGPLLDWLARTGHRFAEVEEILAHPRFSDRPPGHHPATPRWETLATETELEWVEQRIRAWLDEMVAEWNEGDLDAFTDRYAHDAVYAAGDDLHVGRENLRDAYANRAAPDGQLGTLSVQVIDLRPLWSSALTLLESTAPGEVSAVAVFARWGLVRGGTASEGTASLVLRRTVTDWEIVQDVTSPGP